MNNNIHTYRKDMRSLIDWLEFTLPRPSEISPMLTDNQIFWVFELLKIPQSEFKECKTGMNGYRKRTRFNNISVLWDGTDSMGVHVIMSGSGCRAFEEYQLMKQASEEYEPENIWLSLFERILVYSDKFTRFDGSIDDFKTYFNLRDMVNKLDDGLCSSLFNDYKVIRSGKISTGGLKGLTIYLGSATSDFQIVAYDKYLERKTKGKELEDDITSWNRFECRFYDGHATQAIQRLVSGELLGKMIHGTIHRYFNILQPNPKDANRSRWKYWHKWSRFLGGVEKATFNFVKTEKTIDDTLNYVDKYLPRVLAKVFVANNLDLESFEPYIAKGIEMFTEKDLSDLKQHQIDKGYIDEYGSIENYTNVKASQFTFYDDEDDQLRTEMRRQAINAAKKNNQSDEQID